MTPYYADEWVTIYHGDCRDVLPHLDGITACVTDPPYGLEFMGKDWDHGVPGAHFWQVVSDALLPGAPLLAFGGTRTHHRLMCGIEDAGFEIRDCLMWLYGSGFPKSLDIGKAIDKAAGAERDKIGKRQDGAGNGSVIGLGSPRSMATEFDITAPATDAAKLWHGWGTALKPAWEPIVLAMKPLNGTFAQNALEHGVSGLNVDGARIPTEDESFSVPQSNPTNRRGVVGEAWQARSDAKRNHAAQRASIERTATLGRWPANLVLDTDAARLLDEMSGETTSRVATQSAGFRSDAPVYGSGRPVPRLSGANDSGGASRFFYTSKASRADRGEDNGHPTVKPSDLMKWLVTLVRMPERNLLLDPFAGSGTTGYACKELAIPCVLIEQDEAHCETAARRLVQGVLAL